MDLTDADTIERILKEDGVDPLRALITLVQAVIGQRNEWHARDCDDTVLGDDGIQMWTGGCASVALMRYLREAAQDNLQIFDAQAGEADDDVPPAGDDDFCEGLICGEEAGIQDTVMEILSQCMDRADAINRLLEEEAQSDEDEPPLRQAA